MAIMTGLIRKERGAIFYGILLGIVSGLLSFSFLTFINYLMDRLLGGNYVEVNTTYILLFILILIGFVWSRRALSMKIIRLSQNLFWGLRLRVVNLILKSEYEHLDTRRNEIHSVLVHDINTLTNASLAIIELIVSTVVVLSCFTYMATLSLPLFLLTLSVATLGILVYLLGARKNNKRFSKTRDLESHFIKNFNDILSGFKEIFMTPLKGRQIVKNEILPTSKEAYGNNTDAFVGYLNNQITGQVLFFLLIGSVLLFFSIKLEIDPVVTISFLFILLYLLGAIENIMVLLPSLVQAKVSLRRIKELEVELLQSKMQLEEHGIDDAAEQLDSIEIRDMCFKYTSEEFENEFEIGPVNVTIERGDVVFIYGGNGSGKTTFMHVLLGLLHPTLGGIYLNGTVVTNLNRKHFRKLFSVVFNDFHLFDKFYGNEDFDKDEACEYLEIFELQDKVQITDQGFSSTHFSTGQRKRLALIAALLEDTQVIVMDEWAADQDPYFRKKFYTEIIPIIQKKGKTVIAITHDDRYYGNCNKLFRMEFGKLFLEEKTVKQS
jgi:putative ATP-binding cassette transporter